jgi:hypothetical protein
MAASPHREPAVMFYRRCLSAVTISVMPEIAIPIAVPSMIVIEPTAVAFPIAFEKLSSLIAGAYPSGAAIGGASPISVMPPVPPSNWIPIAVYPEIVRSRSSRPRMDDPRWRGWSNPHAYRQLRETCSPYQ